MKSKLKVIFFLITIFNLTIEAGTTIYDSIYTGGQYRKYRLYVPSIYNGSTSVPLVFNLHGYTSNSSQQMAYANFMPVADTANFLVVHPDGTFNFGNQFWNAGFGPGVDDVQFLSRLIDSLDVDYNIDLQRVYSCGMSNGGIMSYYLACNLPNRIAAIASVTGSMLNTWFTCAPARPFPVMEIHGTLDATVPYNGDATFKNIDSVVKKWRVHNNCSPAPVTFSVPDINLFDNSTAVQYKWVGGNNGASVELFKVINGSHSWPGAFPIIANTNQDFSATKEIWRFFRGYKLNQLISDVKENSADQVLLVYPNPSNDNLNIQIPAGAKLNNAVIYDLTGRNVMESTSEMMDVKGLESSVYLLKVNTDKGVYTKRIVIAH